MGGNGLNIFLLDDDHVGLYLLDVSGHGVAAALLSVTLARLLSPSFTQSPLVRVPQPDGQGYRITPPAEVASQLNQWLLANPTGDQYFTLFYGILDIHNWRLCFVSAGHHPGLLHFPANSEPVWLRLPGLPIGCVDGAKFEERILQLDAGDRIFLYSDGFTEAMNADGKQFRLQRIREAIQSSRTETVDASVQHLTREVMQWTEDNPHDDLSMLALAIE